MRYFVLKSPIDKTHIYEVFIDAYGQIYRYKKIPICGDTDAETVIYKNDKYYSSDVIIDYIYHILSGCAVMVCPPFGFLDMLFDIRNCCLFFTWSDF